MDKEQDYIKALDGAERRFVVSGMTVEKRAATDDQDEAFVVWGYAAKFDSPTVIGDWFIEEVAPGFFDEVLDDDVRCLFNHNPNYILARSEAGKGTLTLTVDKTGLKYEYITPNRSYALDLADAIEAGDVSQSSFSFKPKEVLWIENDGEMSKRRLIKCDKLYDVSPVTYPAYTDTTVAKRSHEAWLQEKNKEKETEQRSGENTGRSYAEALVLINTNNK